MKDTRVMVVMGLALLAVGCGDKSPREKCDDLVSMVCDRAVECLPGAAGMHDGCVQYFQDNKFCDSVKSVGGTYDACLDQLDSQSCQQLFPTSSTGTPTATLPSACMGVLSTQSSRGDAPTLPASTSLPVGLRGMVDVRGP